MMWKNTSKIKIKYRHNTCIVMKCQNRLLRTHMTNSFADIWWGSNIDTKLIYRCYDSCGIQLMTGCLQNWNSTNKYSFPIMQNTVFQKYMLQQFIFSHIFIQCFIYWIFHVDHLFLWFQSQFIEWQMAVIAVSSGLKRLLRYTELTLIISAREIRLHS